MKRLIAVIAVCALGLSWFGLAGPARAASGGSFTKFTLDCGGVIVGPDGSISYSDGDVVRVWVVNQSNGQTIGDSSTRMGSGSSSQTFYAPINPPKNPDSLQINVSVPGLGTSSSVQVYSGKCADDGRTFKDGRVDAWNAGQTVAVYCNGNNIEAWRIVNQQGVKALHVQKDAAPSAAPAVGSSAPSAPASSFSGARDLSGGSLGSMLGQQPSGPAPVVGSGGSGVGGGAGVLGSSQGVTLERLSNGRFRVTGPSLDPSKPSEVYTYEFGC